MNQARALIILNEMISTKSLTESNQNFLGLTQDNILSLGPQTSAQASINKYGWPKPRDYWNKEYDYAREEFVEFAKPISDHLRKSFTKACKIAEKRDKNFTHEQISEILDEGLEVQMFNNKLDNDDRHTWRLLDRAINKKDMEDLKHKVWK